MVCDKVIVCDNKDGGECFIGLFQFSLYYLATAVSYNCRRYFYRQESFAAAGTQTNELLQLNISLTCLQKSLNCDWFSVRPCRLGLSNRAFTRDERVARYRSTYRPNSCPSECWASGHIPTQWFGRLERPI